MTTADVSRFLRRVIDVFRRRPVGEIARYAQRRIAWELGARERTRARVARPSPPAEVPGGAILFFTPEASVDRHYASQIVLARTLRELGHRVVLARCYDGFRRCPTMDMYGLPYALTPALRTETCLRCAGNAFEMLDAYGLESVDLRSYRAPGTDARIRELLAAAPPDLRDFRFDGHAFGVLTISDLTLSRKVHDFNRVPDELRACWLQYIEGALESYLTIGEICRRLPVTHLLHYNDYANNEAARLAARQRGIPAFTTYSPGHCNVDRRRFAISADVGGVLCHRQRVAWPAWRELALPPGRVAEVGDDILTRFGGTGSHVYSPAKTFRQGDPRTRLGLATDRQLLVAYTSSLDEMSANRANRLAMGFTEPAPEQPFADQVAWITALTELVARRDDLQLAVRVHPREGPNKRDNASSQHLEILRQRFNAPLPNCRFFWPQDPVSSYDLGELADVALVAWASLGHELSRLGVPVLACTHGLAVASLPWDDFTEWGPTREEYFRKLDLLLARPAHIETVARAFRWYNLYQLGPTVDLSDLIPDFDPYTLPPFRTPHEARTVEDVVLRGHDLMDINRARLVAGQDAHAALREAAAVRHQLRRVLRFLFTGSRAPEDYRLVLARPPGPGELRIDLDGPAVRLSGDGFAGERYSPLCRRLAPLCTDPPG